ncbi:MAG: TerC family protein [Haliscomenobacter sp.]|nr:TerC family protein [Haliscomenobacter sp.]MBK9489505.1 TerC family protein [Haliscomenobacter sp.]
MEATSLILPNFADPQVWISLLTLTFLEIVLGVDNIIFISIAANKLAPADQAKARNIGMILAMVFRIILLFGISALIAMQNPVLSFHGEYLHGAFTGQSLILIAGGLFLLYKATSEIHHKLEGPNAIDDDMNQGTPIFASLPKVIIQIALINIVFSFDSILTAVGLTDSLAIMIVSVVISMLIMMAFAGPVGRFVNTHPTIQMLGLAFLIMIGFMLIAEGAHLAHLSIAGSEVGTVPKGYLYFSIAFSLFVEALNMRLRKKQDPVQLRGYQEEAIQEGVMKP